VWTTPPTRGFLGVEILNPEGMLVYHGTTHLAGRRSGDPVALEFPPIRSARGVFELRVFLRNADAPVRVLEYAWPIPTPGGRPWAPALVHGLAFQRRWPGPASSPDLSQEYAAGPDEPEYGQWLAQRSARADAAVARARAAALTYRPMISVVVPVHDPELDHLKVALASVAAQIYPEWELCIADDASTSDAVVGFLKDYAARDARVKLVRLPRSEHIDGATNAALDLAGGEFVAFLDHDDVLTPDALLEVASLLQEDAAADVIYSDHDILDPQGYRRRPHFKPDWSPELLLSYMYFGHLKVYRTRLIKAVGGLRAGFEGAADYDLALRLVERTDRIRHLPEVLCHWRAAPDSIGRTTHSKPYSIESGRRAVEAALQRRGVAGTAEWPEFARRAAIGVYRIGFEDTRDVPVTIVIPTRDRLDLLRNCLESIETKTTHRAYEILVIDNESREPQTLDYLARSPHRVLPFASGGRLNFAAMMNHGVAAAATEYVVLLNNDTVVIEPEWLDELLGYGQMPGVGAVGAKLLYPNGRIQHAGVLLGIHGLTGHAFQPRPDREAPLEYGFFAHVARNYLAVTAACMLTRKSVFGDLGGFDERNLRVAWNDVDYCLRLREKGYRVVFNAYARLYHLESQSRGDDKDPAEIAYMQAQWKRYVDADPFYNPNLSRRDAEFRIKTDPHEERFFYYH
jgi:GT2 family glycosyltransferase